jgi:hypothetical protein
MLVEGKCQRTMRGKPQAQPEFLTTINLNHIKKWPNVYAFDTLE